MKIRTLFRSTLLASIMGLGMAGAAQADSGNYRIHLYDRGNYCPLHPGYQHRGHMQYRDHGRGRHHGLYRDALRRHHRHHHEHGAYLHERRGYPDRRHERYDGHENDYRHRSSYSSGIDYTGRH